MPRLPESTSRRESFTLANRIQDLLLEKEDSWTVFLTKLYQSTCCHVLYIFAAVLCVILAVYSVLMGRKWDSEVIFVIYEFFLNIFILFDICFKIKLVGFASFFDELNNRIDFIFGFIIFGFWVIWLIYASLSKFELDDAIETVFYIIWCIWQYKRMITLFKEAATIK